MHGDLMTDAKTHSGLRGLLIMVGAAVIAAFFQFLTVIDLIEGEPFDISDGLQQVIDQWAQLGNEAISTIVRAISALIPGLSFSVNEQQALAITAAFTFFIVPAIRSAMQRGSAALVGIFIGLPLFSASILVLALLAPPARLPDMVIQFGLLIICAPAAFGVLIVLLERDRASIDRLYRMVRDLSAPYAITPLFSLLWMAALSAPVMWLGSAPIQW